MIASGFCWEVSFGPTGIPPSPDSAAGIDEEESVREHPESMIARLKMVSDHLRVRKTGSNRHRPAGCMTIVSGQTGGRIGA